MRHALQVLGFSLHSIHAVPGGLWEGFIGVWLIAKDFSTRSVPLGPTTSPTTLDVVSRPMANTSS